MHIFGFLSDHQALPPEEEALKPLLILFVLAPVQCIQWTTRLSSMSQTSKRVSRKMRWYQRRSIHMAFMHIRLPQRLLRTRRSTRPSGQVLKQFQAQLQAQLEKNLATSTILMFCPQRMDLEFIDTYHVSSKTSADWFLY